MPTYEYVCKACEHEFEREQRISDPPVKLCPQCRSRQVKRLISRTRFHLKGGGWYSDLYSSKKGDKAGKSDASDKGGSEKGGAAKPDAPSKGDSGGGKGSDGGSGPSSKAAA